MENNIKIIMLDSGIGSYQIEECKKNNDVSIEEKDIDKIGHGCAVFHILSSSGIAVESIKIIDSDEIEEEILIHELRKLSKREDLYQTVINISMGITFCREKDALLEICQTLNEKGCIIVSAFDNDGAISYPAAFPCVIGVDTSRKCRKLTEYEYVEDSMVNIRGFGGMQVLPDLNGNREKYIGSSFVAPHIAVKIMEMLKHEKLDYEQVLLRLKEDAVKVYKNENPNVVVEKAPTIKKAIVFPLNKEITNLLRYPELLPFEIIDIYDFHHMRTVNKKISQIIGKEVEPDLIVKNISDIDWNGDFDTVIMGHMVEINQTLHCDYTERFLENAKKAGKKIYAFDPLTEYVKETEHVDIQFPHIDKSNVPQNRFGKQFQIHCPIIGIFGTSSKQGKFTLQLELRKKFSNDKYKIAQLSTEPNGYLYGMDAVYPMGYGGNVTINGYDEIVVINNMLNQIVKDDTDLLIIGAQSQTVAYSSQNIALYPIGNVNLLLASFPDLIILCVNCYDDMDYIKRTIRYLEGIIDTQVLALVVSPFMQEYSGSSMVRNTYFIEAEQLQSHREEIQKQTGIETFLLNKEEDIEKLYNLAVNTLS